MLISFVLLQFNVFFFSMTRIKNQQPIAKEKKLIGKRGKKKGSRSEKITKRIKELMDISNNRIGNLIVDLSNEMDGFERRCEAKMEKLQA